MLCCSMTLCTSGDKLSGVHLRLHSVVVIFVVLVVEIPVG